MTAKNPHLNHLERPAYELPALLINLGHVSHAEPLSDDQRNMVAAIANHASYSADKITGGLEAIGKLLYVASLNTEVEPDGYLCGIGEMVSYLAVQLQHLHDVESDMAFFVRNDHAMKTKGDCNDKPTPST